MNMIISDTDFLYEESLYLRDSWSGRCYRQVEPSGFYSKAAREGGLVKKRISLARYAECREACIRSLAGGAA
jgi:hypothetical protein